MKKTLCKCGCNEEIKVRPWHKYKGIPSYIKGHYWNGKKRDTETNNKVSVANKGRLCFWKGKSRPIHSQWMKDNWSGDNHPNWKGGIACEPYCDAWTDQAFKQSIKDRDGNICINPDCWKTSNKLTLHHINYIKKDCKPTNLITICQSCNSRANVNKRWHQSWYLAILYRRYGYKTRTNIKG